MTLEQTLSEDFTTLGIMDQYELLFDILDKYELNLDSDTRREVVKLHGEKLRIIREANTYVAESGVWSKDAVIKKCLELQREL